MMITSRESGAAVFNAAEANKKLLHLSPLELTAWPKDVKFILPARMDSLDRHTKFIEHYLQLMQFKDTAQLRKAVDEKHTLVICSQVGPETDPSVVGPPMRCKPDPRPPRAHALAG
jgi:hypothetical protein